MGLERVIYFPDQDGGKSNLTLAQRYHGLSRQGQ